MNQNQPPRWIKWFIYYTVILSVPMILGIAIYFHARWIIERNSEEIYAAALERARFEADSLIQTATQTLDYLIASRDVQKLTFITGNGSPDDVYSMYTLMGELKKYSLISPVLDDIFVVLNKTGTVLGPTGSVYQELYYDVYYRDEEFSPQGIAAAMAKNHWLDVVPVSDRFLFLKSTLDSNVSVSSVTAVVAIKRSRFIDLFSGLAEETAAYIFDNTGRIIAASAGAPELPASFDPAVPGTSLKKDGRFYYPLITSSSIGWRYLCLIPAEVQRGRLRRLSFSSLAALLICSFFTLFFSLRMTKHGYRTQQVLCNDLEMLRKFCIYTLLEKPWNTENGHEELYKYQIEFPGEKVMVLFFVVCGEEAAEKARVLSRQQGNRIGLIRSHLIKTFAERVKQRFSVETTDVGENTAAILSWSGSRDIALLEDDIEETQRDLETRFRTSVAAVLGEEHSFPEGIYTSALEAREALLYLDTSSGQSILHYSDIKNSAGRYQFPLEMEQKLINLIREEDEEAACLLVRQLFALNTACAFGPVIRILAADVLGAVMKGQSLASGLAETEAHADVLAFNQVPVRELAPSLERIIRETCAKSQAAGEKKTKSKITEKMQTYIRENFRNPDINISITGFHFEMSPFYLSRIFKEETGTSLLEFINTLRVEEGKKLLAEGYSVTQTAELTGFRGSNAFIRVFKNIIGLTPGQYKENL